MRDPVTDHFVGAFASNACTGRHARLACPRALAAQLAVPERKPDRLSARTRRAHLQSSIGTRRWQRQRRGAGQRDLRQRPGDRLVPLRARVLINQRGLHRGVQPCAPSAPGCSPRSTPRACSRCGADRESAAAGGRPCPAPPTRSTGTTTGAAAARAGSGTPTRSLLAHTPAGAPPVRAADAVAGAPSADRPRSWACPGATGSRSAAPPAAGRSSSSRPPGPAGPRTAPPAHPSAHPTRQPAAPAPGTQAASPPPAHRVGSGSLPAVPLAAATRRRGSCTGCAAAPHHASRCCRSPATAPTTASTTTGRCPGAAAGRARPAPDSA